MVMHIIIYILQFIALFFNLSAIFIGYIKSTCLIPCEFREGYSNTGIENNTDDVSEELKNDAIKIAESIYGNNKGRIEIAVNRYLSVYNTVKNNDFVIFFNSGGFGWADFKVIPTWVTIIDGIKEYLSSKGKSVYVINFIRTYSKFWSMKTEADVIVGHGTSKTDELTGMIELLLKYTKCNVLLTGESQGAAVCEFTIQRFKNSPRVFSIQTGSPFWNLSKPFSRSLVINDNGRHYDTFALGEWGTMIKVHYNKIVHHEEVIDAGNIFNIISAPGHQYSWEFNKVRNEIIDFIDKEMLSNSEE